jgi:16S rRNA (uracil1498-N3)-methyltransferase
MPERFFLRGDAVTGGAVVVEGPVARHIARSLRMRAGESIVVVDGGGADHGGGAEHGVRLRSVGSERVEGDITWSRPATGEARLRITVVQALPRERMEDCVDVLVEAGAAEIRPVITERAVSRPVDDRIPHRVQRWQAVATEAAQLAGRGMIPRVHAPASMPQALAALDVPTRVVACTFDGARSIADIEVDASVPLALCIGPEGGFGDSDLDALRDTGAEFVHLGARILRTRYAGGVACALLLACCGDLADPVTPPPSG